MESLTQVSQLRDLVPVEPWNWRCRCGYFSKGGGDDRFPWSNARGMMSSDERLHVVMVSMSWWW